MKKIAVVLSGCGVFDGAEVFETTLTLLALDNAGARVQCMAPNINQHHVINHLTGKEVPDETRNVLVESARLVRGEIIDIAKADATDYAAVIFPGGYGAAKNLSDFAFAGSNCVINEQVMSFAREFLQANKPIGFICITPTLAPKIVADTVTCTIGDEQEAADAINTMGGVHQNCGVEDIVVDNTHKIVSTPAYMLGESIGEVNKGITKLVTKVLALA